MGPSDRQPWETIKGTSFYPTLPFTCHYSSTPKSRIINKTFLLLLFSTVSDREKYYSKWILKVKETKAWFSNRNPNTCDGVKMTTASLRNTSSTLIVIKVEPEASDCHKRLLYFHTEAGSHTLFLHHKTTICCKHASNPIIGKSRVEYPPQWISQGHHSAGLCVCVLWQRERETAEQSDELQHETETVTSIFAQTPILCNSPILNLLCLWKELF